MDATISPMSPGMPAFQRAITVLAELVQAVLMAVGFATLIALAAVYQNSGSWERLQAWLPSVVTTSDGAELVENWQSQPVTDAGDPLSPRMRAALDNVSRRYRVSGDALEPIFATAEAAGRDLRLDPLLIVAVIAIESRFNPFSESVVGAQGLMQVMPVHQDKLPAGADELSFFDPVVNVRIGSRVLKESIRRHGGLAAGLQQFGGSADDPAQRYAAKVLAEKARLDAAVQRARLPEA